ncbi:MAG: hypothetical protein PHE49_00665 [bacterium]|nr:hypothetical protein [bacterium]
MKKLFLLCLSAILILGIVGCGKKSNTGAGDDLPDNYWTEIAVSAVKPPTDTTTKKGDKYLPINLWRQPGTATVTAIPSIKGSEASISGHITWPDTLVVAYWDSTVGSTEYYDTVSKPTPNFTGDVTYYYKVKNNKWAFTGLTPGKIVSDSAGTYVNIDSIQIEVLGEGVKPTITSPTQLISAEDTYPYIFNVGDSIKITVYKSGSLSDNSVVVFLHVPALDYTSPFAHISGTNKWEGTWVPKDAQARWAWVDVFDWGVLFNKTQTSERDMLWGIPYKVE